MTAAKVMDFLEGLKIPEGPRAGEKLRLADFQRRFVAGALDPENMVACLSIARGNAKTALSSGLALATLMGLTDKQPRREILFAARNRDQAKIAFNFLCGFVDGLPKRQREKFTIRRGARLEVEYAGNGGGLARCIAADGRSVLGGAPVMAILDERAAWEHDRGDALENGILSGLGKRGGKALIISTSAPDDLNAFSKWLDNPPPQTFVQQHRPPEGLPADDLDSLLIANPGAQEGIGASVEWLQAQARRAIARGGSALASFRNLNRNERVSTEVRDVLLSTDAWLAVEAGEVPPREGACVVGVDLGGSASMTAAAYFWPASGRLEVKGWFPSKPSLLDRGQADGVSGRYLEMHERGELSLLGDLTVPIPAWLGEVMAHVEGEPVLCLTADRYKQSELAEAAEKAGVNVPIVWRGQGFRDGAEDVSRFQRACFDGFVSSAPSLLMRSALADSVVVRDVAGNGKLAKGRSGGRIDAAAAAILAVAEGMRRTARPQRPARAAIWA